MDGEIPDRRRAGAWRLAYALSGFMASCHTSLPPTVGQPHFPLTPTPNFALPGAAVRAEIPHPVRLQIVSPCAAPPAGDGWLHEVKHDGHRVLAPAGLVKFGLSGKDLWQRLEGLRTGSGTRSGIVPVRLELVAGVRYFGRYRTGWIRDGVLLSIG